MMNSAPTQVTDAAGGRHRLGICLGRGGQGAVYSVKGTPFVVKLIEQSSPSRQDWLRNQLTFVKRLELRDLPIAQPLEMLREPHVGYVMEMVTGMEPLSRLIEPPSTESSLGDWYRARGGVRRRLQLLARTADVFNALHAKGLIYGDVSGKNVFVSADASREEVCLIDCDNIRYQSAPQISDVYTVGYGAPELVLGRSAVNSLTEAHGFAVLAFQTLTATHPLIGDYVHDGDPELEQQAFEGRLPWIDEPTNDLNRSRFGIDRSKVLSPRLSRLFQDTFGPGLTNPLVRPGISRWVDRLHTAADATIRCSQCSSTYFPTQKRCPWCLASRPSLVNVRLHLWDPGLSKGKEILMSPDEKPVLVGGVIMSDGDTVEISARLALGLDGVEGTRRIASIALNGGRAKICVSENDTYQLISPDRKHSVALSDRPAVMKIGAAKDSWLLHFGPLDKLHRCAVFERRNEVKQ
jgi:eukaryotic-like serine/threonine-protein kinase